MHKQFDAQAIEPKWQSRWQQDDIYKTTDTDKKPKAFILDMFPYPSGEGLHVGHPKGFIATDIYSRYKRMTGHEVLHPMGWDAFGLPAENFAIKNKVHPRTAVDQNIANFKKQLGLLGMDYDWSREINTTDPQFYKWTQWIFVQLLKKGLAYQSHEPINWCPGCQTGLANEDLEPDGTCERCDSVVEKRPMRQWVLNIRKYADRMLEDLDTLSWPEHIKEAQRNWIGRSEGAKINFEINTGKKHFVLLHGFTGSPEEGFIPWLKQELEAKGHTVETPTLPNTNEPTEKEQVSYVLENCTFSDNTVLIGHSLGCVVALKVAQTINIPLHKLILVAGFMTPDFKDHSRNFANTFEWGFDIEKIKENTSEIVILSAHNDSAVGLEHGKKLADSLGGRLVEFDAEDDHVCGKNEPTVLKHALDYVTVFTTRPDTLFGATYMVLAPEHELVQNNKSGIANWEAVAAYIQEAANKKEMDRLDESKEKTGVRVEGITATNPANGEEIPVYIADYVLASYGTGAIMAVPAHDERDFEFANKFGIEIRPVIARHYDLDTKEGVETLDRGDVVDLIIEHPTDGTFLLQREIDKNGPDHVHFVGGGTDGESHNVAIARELLEETGYRQFDIVSGPVEVHTAFAYRHTKGKNQRTKSYFYHIKLTNLEQEASEIEEGRHTVEWVSAQEVAKNVTWEAHKNAWLAYMSGAVYTGKGNLVNSGEFDGMDSDKAKAAIVEKVDGRMAKTYKIKDWVFSRQRYWGEPFPIIHGEDGVAYPVSFEQLPVTLPEVENYAPAGNGESPLATIDEWVNVTGYVNDEGEFVVADEAPEGATLIKGTRETNTMPQWAGSSWYYLRYIDPHNENALVDPEKEKKWQPVDVYVGGDHAVRHLIYARFWHKFLYDIGVVSTVEPFQRLEFLGFILAEDGRKMSKRWGNIINPDDIVDQVGADTMRVYEMFMGPFENTIAWSQDGLAGARRFLERVNGLAEHVTDTEVKETTTLLHKTITKVCHDIEAFKFNTAVSAMMIFLNQAEKTGLTEASYKSFLRLLAPFAPHLLDELWEQHGYKKSIHIEPYPEADEAWLQDDVVTIGVQVNGKVRGDITLSPEADEATALDLAHNNPSIAKYCTNTPTKVIYVPGKILNIVIKD